MFDFWGDNESSNHITLKMIGAGLDPIVAKYKLIYDQSTPRIEYLYSMKMESRDLSFCASKNEMVFYSPKTRRIMGQRWESRTLAGVPENKLYYPLNDYGITYVQHFNCIPEKGVFQILGINTDGKKQVITFRGGESTRAGRRVHSITPVEDSVTFIESGFNFDYVITVASFPGIVSEKRSFIVTYPEGPIFQLDNTLKNQNYTINLAMKPDQATEAIEQKNIQITITNPVYFAVLQPQSKFDIKVNEPIFLDDVANITGPVMDMILSGDDASKIKVTKRNNKHKGMPLGETGAPNRIYNEKDYMVLQYTGSKIRIFGDPTTTRNPNSTAAVEILSKSNLNVLDCALIKYGTSDEAVLIVKTYEQSSYAYSIYWLYKKTVDGKQTYTSMESLNIYQTKTDFDSLQVTSLEKGEIVIGLRNKKSFVSNFIKLVAFQISMSKFAFKTEVNVFSGSSMEIGWYSLVSNGKGQATLVGNYQGQEGLIVANWDTDTPDIMFYSSAIQFKISEVLTRPISV